MHSSNAKISLSLYRNQAELCKQAELNKVNKIAKIYPKLTHAVHNLIYLMLGTTMKSKFCIRIINESVKIQKEIFNMLLIGVLISLF